MSRSERPSVQQVAVRLASEWAQRTVRDPHTTGAATERELAATVLLDMAAELEELRRRAAAAEQLARDLGYDMLYALESAYVDGDGAEKGMLYLARGWKRDMNRIEAADCTEGRALADKLPDTSDL